MSLSFIQRKKNTKMKHDRKKNCKTTTCTIYFKEVTENKLICPKVHLLLIIINCQIYTKSTYHFTTIFQKNKLIYAGTLQQLWKKTTFRQHKLKSRNNKWMKNHLLQRISLQLFHIYLINYFHHRLRGLLVFLLS